jgi:hypothetical protein
MKELHDQTEFRRALGGMAKVMIKQVPKDVWEERVVQILLKASVDAPIVDDATVQGQVKMGIRDYLREVPATESKSEAGTDGTPYKKNGKVWFSSKKFYQWYQSKGGDKISEAKLISCLQIAEFEHKPLWLAGHSEKRWALPEGFKIEEEVSDERD